jgi:hypothetical protein
VTGIGPVGTIASAGAANVAMHTMTLEKTIERCFMSLS